MNRSDNLSGILLFLWAVTCGAASGAFSKVLVQEIPVSLILWGRFAVAVVIIGAVALFVQRPASLRPPQPALLACRGLLLAGSATFTTIAFVGLPLADAIAILFTYPFIIIVLAALILKERVPAASWAAVGLGFIGTLIMFRPGGDAYSVYGVAAALGGASYGIHLLITRGLAVSTAPIVTALWTGVFNLILFSALLPFAWQPLTAKQAALLGLIGVLTATNQLSLIVACTKTEASTLAPFGYAEIVGATAFGLILFGDLPDMLTWIGIAIIILSGVYLALSTNGKLPLLSRSRPPG